MEFPSELKYTESHEWAKVQGNVVLVGITDFAQEQLGDIVFVELPTVGKKVKQFDEAGNVESAKAVGELKMPVSGEIVEVNKKLEDHPELVNSSPYREGWMVKIKLANPADLNKLLPVDKYKLLAKAH
jgi:glycine cleavage system H protein